MIIFIIAFVCFSVAINASQAPIGLSGNENAITFEDTGKTHRFAEEFVKSFYTFENLLDDIGNDLPIPSSNNVKQSDFYYLWDILKPTPQDIQFPWALPYDQLRNRLKQKFLSLSIDSSKNPYTFLTFINYLSPKNKDLLFAFASLYANKLEGMYIPIDHINDLKPYIAGTLLANLLADEKIQGDTFTLEADRVGQQSSEKGITCIKEKRQYYCTFEENKLILNKNMRIFGDSTVSHGVSSDNKYMYYTTGGYSTMYLMGVVDLQTKSSLYEDASVLGNLFQNQPHRAHPYKIAQSHWEWDDGGGFTLPTGVVYNPSAERFYLTFVRPDKQEFIIAQAPIFDLESGNLPFDIETFPYSKFKNDLGHTLDGIAHLTWQFIEGNMVGVDGEEQYCFLYNPIDRKITYLNEKEREEKYTILHTWRTYQSAACQKNSLIPGYKDLLNRKISRCEIPEGLTTYFDFVYLRYLQSADGTKTIHVTDVIPQKLLKALQFINKKYVELGSGYTNIDVDAWWVVQGQKNSGFFRFLLDEDPTGLDKLAIINAVSKEIKEIYPSPPSLMVQTSTIKKSVSSSNQNREFSILESLRKNIGAWALNPYNTIKKLGLNKNYRFFIGFGLTGVLATWFAFKMRNTIRGF